MRIYKLKISKAVMKEFLLSATAMFLITVTMAKPELVLAADEASKLESSKLVTGIKSLFTDAGKVVALLSPLVAGAVAAYNGLKLSSADDDEVRPIKKRMKVCVIGGIVGLIGGSMISVILGYFN